MQRHIMINRQNIPFLQIIDQLLAFVFVRRLDIEHVGIMDAALRNHRQLNLACLRKWRQQLIVLIPARQPCLIDLICHFQLCIQIRHI